MKNTSFEKNYQMLNEAQKDAVDTIYGPVMVVAGPGTGKTQIIGLRTANILEKTDTNPENILITTFTEAGVIAIKKRLISFIGNEAYKVKVSTIHSFSQDVIKSYPEKFLEYNAGEPIDDVDAIEVLKHLLDTLYEKKLIKELYPPFDNYFYLRDIKGNIGKLKQEGISIEDFKESIEIEKENLEEELSQIKPTLKKYETTRIKNEKQITKLNELAVIFESYNKHLRKNNIYDFNDMINFVLEKFKEDKELRLFYAEQYQFIMLDEFQDTNNAQNEIVNLILSESNSEGEFIPNIMVVGDDDQSIYRFQGANIENMLNFSHTYPDTKVIVLKNNYRSQQNILDMSTCLIDKNEERLSKKLPSIEKQLISSGKNKTGPKPYLYKAMNTTDEKSFVLEKLKNVASFSGEGERIQDGGLNIEEKTQTVAPENIAIIVRSNREVGEWSNFLEANNIPVESKLKTNILNNPFINFIINFLEIINNPYKDDSKLLDLLRSDLLEVDNIDILNINQKLYSLNYSRKEKLTLFSFICDDENLEKLLLNDLESIKNFRDNILKSQGKTAYNSFVEYFKYLIEEAKIYDFINEKGNFDDIEDLLTFLNLVKEYNKKDKNLTTEKLLKKINLFREYNISIPRQVLKTEKKGVQVLTAHGSKGLEYEIVFIPGLYYRNRDYKTVPEKLKLPTSLVGEGVSVTKKNKLEEERRLFFVAVTRAERELYLTFPAGEGTKPLLPSSFIEEVEELIDSGESNSTIEDTKKLEESLKNLFKKTDLISSSQEELDYIEEFLKTYKLSASDLNTFLEDPKVFLRDKVFKYPFEDNEFTIFGKVYHRVLELFFTKYKKDKILPNKSYLTASFKLLLEREILTDDEFTRLMEKGLEGLQGYYDTYKNSFKIPLHSEFNFRSRNIAFENIPLTGKIDKIEIIGSSSKDFSKDNQEELGMGQLAFFKENIVLIDYKTGSPKTLGMVKGVDRYGNKKDSPSEGKYFRQLLFYKLMCDLDREFRNNYQDIVLALDFVEGKDGVYKYLEVDYTEEDYEDFKNLIKDSWEKMNDMEFWREMLKN